MLCQEWYGIKHVSARQTRSLVNVDMLVSNPELADHAYMGGLHYLIMSLWQTPLFPKTRLLKEAKATLKKLGKMRLVPNAPLLWMVLSMSSSSYPHLQMLIALIPSTSSLDRANVVYGCGRRND